MDLHLWSGFGKKRGRAEQPVRPRAVPWARSVAPWGGGLERRDGGPLGQWIGAWGHAAAVLRRGGATWRFSRGNDCSAPRAVGQVLRAPSTWCSARRHQVLRAPSTGCFARRRPSSPRAVGRVLRAPPVGCQEVVSVVAHTRKNWSTHHGLVLGGDRPEAGACRGRRRFPPTWSFCPRAPASPFHPVCPHAPYLFHSPGSHPSSTLP
jgi:hypothetical protein